MIRGILKELSHITILPKRYKTPKGRTREFWSKVVRRYANAEKDIESSDYRWRIIVYDDGRRELAYLRVLKGGLFSGLYPAIYRGVIIPRRIGYGTFAHIKRIELAF